jgi:diketogulonate reductase-like aldo/keto reductase
MKVLQLVIRQFSRSVLHTMSQSLKLNSGDNIPLLGLGTWQSKPGEVQAAVIAAVEAGYKHIDCAYAYGNEGEVGKALKHLFDSGKVTRNDLVITGKLWNTRHNPADVKPSVKESLDNLGLDYLDIYLIHWPTCFKAGADNFPKDASGNILYDNVQHLDTWKALEACVDEGLIKSIGLSNFNSVQIQNILDNCRIKPAVLQVEVNLYFQQHKLVKFCQERGVAVVSYSSLGSPSRPLELFTDPTERPHLEDPVLLQVAQRLRKSPAQVVLRWLVQRNVAVIPKSVTPARIVDNSKIWDFSLSDDDVKLLNSVDKNRRCFACVVERDGFVASSCFFMELHAYI